MVSAFSTFIHSFSTASNDRLLRLVTTCYWLRFLVYYLLSRNWKCQVSTLLFLLLIKLIGAEKGKELQAFQKKVVCLCFLVFRLFWWFHNLCLDDWQMERRRREWTATLRSRKDCFKVCVCAPHLIVMRKEEEQRVSDNRSHWISIDDTAAGAIQSNHFSIWWLSFWWLHWEGFFPWVCQSLTEKCGKWKWCRHTNPICGPC